MKNVVGRHARRAGGIAPTAVQTGPKQCLCGGQPAPRGGPIWCYTSGHVVPLPPDDHPTTAQGPPPALDLTTSLGADLPRALGALLRFPLRSEQFETTKALG